MSHYTVCSLLHVLVFALSKVPSNSHLLSSKNMPVQTEKSAFSNPIPLPT
jgi:hypothetical protein